MAANAARILARGLEAAGVGGRVVYSTCTISHRESEEVVSGSGASVRDLGAEPGLGALAASTDRRCVQTRNDRDGTDGFFVAALSA